MALVDTVCKGLEHIWHQDSFQLEIECTTSEPCLSGSICFGDCIDDEWLVVWLLSEATRLDPSLSVSVRDNDGEVGLNPLYLLYNLSPLHCSSLYLFDFLSSFSPIIKTTQFLLIETSPSWPRSLNWLDPDSSQNRVWLRHGTLHIISHGNRETLKIEKAFELLRSSDNEIDKNSNIRKGDLVKIGGLSGRTELNGQVGKCMGAAHDRLVIELKGNKERLKVKPHNLFKVITSEAPGPVVDAFLLKLKSVQETLKVNKQVVKMMLPMEIALLL